MISQPEFLHEWQTARGVFRMRPLVPEENSDVARLIRTVMTEFGAVGQGFSIMDPEVDHMYEAYSVPGAAYVVLVQQGEVVGGGGYGPLVGGPPQVCELKKMYFYPQARGLGLGKAMANYLLQAAREAGYARCYLETLLRMEKANRLYQDLGFRKLDGALGNTGHTSCDAYYALDLRTE